MTCRKEQMAQHTVLPTKMKRIRHISVLMVCLVLLVGCSEQEPKAIKLATTTSTVSSGLLDVLLPAFQAKTGITVQVPPFVENDEIIRVDTRSGEYVERVR